MLIPDFYTITEFSFTNDQVRAKIMLNPDHEIYKGHFPEQDVVPGVIQLQIIKEFSEKALDKKLFLSEMAFAKFLKLIIPANSPQLFVNIDFVGSEKNYSFTAKIETENSVFTKVKGVYIPQD